MQYGQYQWDSNDCPLEGDQPAPVTLGYTHRQECVVFVFDKTQMQGHLRGEPCSTSRYSICELPFEGGKSASFTKVFR